MASDRRPIVIAVVKSDYKFWMTLFGALLSVPPIISLMQKTFKIGLAPILYDVLAYYRNLCYPIIEKAMEWLSFIPLFDFYSFIYSGFMSRESYKDLAVLSFVLAIALHRVVVRNNLAWENLASAIAVTMIFLVLFGALAFTLMPLVFPPVVLGNMLRYKDNTDRLQYLVSLGIALIAAAAFYITNALVK